MRAMTYVIDPCWHTQFLSFQMEHSRYIWVMQRQNQNICAWLKRVSRIRETVCVAEREVIKHEECNITVTGHTMPEWIALDDMLACVCFYLLTPAASRAAPELCTNTIDIRGTARHIPLFVKCL